MAEQPLADAGERGRTVIADAVLERLAAHAALEVDGVVPTGSGLDTLVGRRLPKADGTVAGQRARVALDVALAWPHPVAAVAGQVREHVSSRLRELTGLDIDAVDVQVARVVHVQHREPGRVR